MSVVSEQMPNAALQRVILVGMRDSLDNSIDASPMLRSTLEHSIRNYTQFDEECWKLLINIGYETLQLPDTTLIAEKMINEIQNKYENETDKKIKNKIKSQLESIEQIIIQNK